MKITKISAKGLALIKQYEGFRSLPYKDGGGVSTIGYGTTFYPNGNRVTMTDSPITEQEATDLLINMVRKYEMSVDSMTRDDINQNQFDALCIFAYNVGVNALKKSTLLKKVNANPNDESIRVEFVKWIYDEGKKSKGLLNRRQNEAALYFS